MKVREETEVLEISLWGPQARDPQFFNAFPVEGCSEQGEVRPRAGTV